MTKIDKSGKLLVVDSSTAMLHVLKNFTGKHGYDADHYADPADACTQLDQRFQDFSCDYRCVVLGWPEGRLNLIDELLQKLSSADHDALPLIVIAQDMNADVRALVKRRPKTRAYLWSEYQQISEIIDLSAKNKLRKQDERIAATPAVPSVSAQSLAAAQRLSVARQVGSRITTAEAEQNGSANRNTITDPMARQAEMRSADFSSEFSILLVDTAPSVCETLREQLESAGYSVAIASSVDEAKKRVEKTEFDAVVTDFFLPGESGEVLCEHLQNSTVNRKPVCIVLTAKYSDSIVKRSLAVGAAACLYKNESTGLLFARIDALTRTLRRQSRQIPLGQPVLSESPAVETTAETTVETAVETAVASGTVESGSAESGDIGKAGTVSLHTSTATVLQGSGQSARDQKAGMQSSGVRRGVVKLVSRAADPAVAGVDGGSSPMKVSQTTTARKNVTDRQQATAKNSSGESAIEHAEGIVAADAGSSVVSSAVKRHNTAGIQSKSTQSQAAEQSINGAPQAAPAKSSAPGKIVALPAMLEQLNNRNPAVQYTMLMLDIEIEAATGDRMALRESEPMQKLVIRSLGKLYPKQNAQAHTEDGKFVLLLTTAKFQDALVLTRKILQLIPKMVPYLNNMTLVAHAGVLRIGRDESIDQHSLIKQCEAACQKARNDGKDNAALVLPNNQYLSATSATDAQPPESRPAEESGKRSASVDTRSPDSQDKDRLPAAAV